MQLVNQSNNSWSLEHRPWTLLCITTLVPNELSFNTCKIESVSNMSSVLTFESLWLSVHWLLTLCKSLCASNELSKASKDGSTENKQDEHWQRIQFYSVAKQKSLSMQTQVMWDHNCHLSHCRVHWAEWTHFLQTVHRYLNGSGFSKTPPYNKNRKIFKSPIVMRKK